MCIQWTDASFNLDDLGVPPDSFDVETFGWIVGTNLTFTTIASELLPEGQFRSVSHIPTVLIRKIVDLVEGL